MQYQDILDKLENVRGNGAKRTARCPVPGHGQGKGDRGNSLSANEGDDGKTLLHCHAGCSLREICDALGIMEADLFSNPQAPGPPHDRRPPAGKQSNAPEGRLVATYPYHNLDRQVAHETLRYEPKRFSQRRPDDKGGWINSIEGVVTQVYHRPEVETARLYGERIWVSEGEKDCEAGYDHGMISTCAPMGAGKWHDHHTAMLAGAAEVVVIPDADPPGLKHARAVADDLYGHVGVVKLLAPLPGCKDLAEWFEKGHTIDELEELVEGTKPYRAVGRVVRRQLSTVTAETVEFLWEPYIPLGKLTLNEGDPGVGKSTATVAIATAVTLGRGLPNTPPFTPGTVLLASAEDGIADTIRPRFDAMGADVSRVWVMDGLFTLDDAGLEMLRQHIAEVAPTLVVIDPLVAYMGGDKDINKANQVRMVTAALAALAEAYGCAIVCVRHLTKGASLKPIYRGLGSIDFTAAARSVLLAGHDPETHERGLLHIKCNVGPLGPPVGFTLDEGRFMWTDGCDLTVERVMAADTGGTALQDAKDFLRGALAAGPREAKDVLTEAEASGIAEKTVRRAKAKLGVMSTQEKKPGGRGASKWNWELPRGSESDWPPE
jgi:hypothetical protein